MLCWSASPGSQWCPRWFSEGTSHYQAWRTWGEAWPVRCPGISSQLLCWKYQKVKNTKEMHKTHSIVTVCNIYPHYWTQTPSLQTGKQTHSMVIAYSQTWPMTGASAMECSTLRPHWPSGKKNTLTLLSHLRNKNLQSVGLLGYISCRHLFFYSRWDFYPLSAICPMLSKSLTTLWHLFLYCSHRQTLYWIKTPKSIHSILIFLVCGSTDSMYCLKW